MGSLTSEDLNASAPTRISFFVPEMYSSLEESIDTAITVSGKSFQIPGLLTSSRNQSESVSPSGNMNNPQKKGVQGTLVFPSFPKRWGGYALVIRNSRKEIHNATRTPQQTHSGPEL